MDVIGRFTGITRNLATNKVNISFEVEDGEAVEGYALLKDERVSFTAKKWRAKRSLDANGLLWKCLGEIAAALHADKWDIYLKMLKRYGVYTYVIVKPNAVEAMKRQWRECEVVGESNINGTEAVQMLCYFGSSTYDSKEFSTLLEGVISEMKEIGIPVPPSKEMLRAIEQLEARDEKQANKGN